RVDGVAGGGHRADLFPDLLDGHAVGEAEDHVPGEFRQVLDEAEDGVDAADLPQGGDDRGVDAEPVEVRVGDLGEDRRLGLPCGSLGGLSAEGALDTRQVDQFDTAGDLVDVEDDVGGE